MMGSFDVGDKTQTARIPLACLDLSDVLPPGHVLHTHPAGTWHLCDRSYRNGKQRHKVLESYGRARPTLFAPVVSSGVDRDVLPRLADASFDLIYLDPPYGTTAGEWDRAPVWSWLGAELHRLLKPTGQAVLHGTVPMVIEAAHAFYSSGLRHRFDIPWVKTGANGRLRTTAWVSDFEPIRAHEWILTLALAGSRTKGLTFNLPAMRRQTDARKVSRRVSSPSHQGAGWAGDYSSKLRPGQGWPVDVIVEEPAHGVDLYAQKPEDLTSYLVMLLTNPGDVILDPYAGSGTTLRVAWRLGRRSTGFEAQPDRYARLADEFRGTRAPYGPIGAEAGGAP